MDDGHYFFTEVHVLGHHEFKSFPFQRLQTYLGEALSSKKLGDELLRLNTRFHFVNENNSVIGYLKVNIDDAKTDIKEVTGIELERIYVVSSF